MELAVLGPLTVNGVDTGLPRRDRVVLAVLVLYAGEVVGAERLADALWGERPPASWAKVVQGCVVRLRRVLGASAIETVQRGYRLRLAADDVDVLRFERLLGRGRELLGLGEPARASFVLGEALALWRGPALIDLDEWVAGGAEVRRLNDLRLDAEELQLEAALQLGRHLEVLGVARTRVEETPLRERRWALLAVAQYQAGQQAEALRTLREVRTVLSHELGLDPGPDLTALEGAILRHDPALVPEDPPREARASCPYRGLLPYDLADADDFHGRDHDIGACRDRLSAVGALTVVGPSGSGKSSLVRAGLAAALEREGQRVVVVTPGAHPMDAVSGLSRTGGTPVLVVDQCEETFGLCPDPVERASFFTALTEYAEGARLIVAVRADRLGDLTTHAGFTRLVERSLYLLNPMTPGDLRTAIEGPARGAGLRLEPGLVDLLVREVEGEPGGLPLLSHALRATWERREANTLTVAGYRDTGGVRGAVARSAETVYEQVPADQRPALRDLLLRLIAPNPDGDPMRSRLPRRLLTGAPHHERLIETLVAARLLTSDDGVVELAHEALVRAWPRLHDWLDEDAEGQRILRHLVVAADTWVSMGRPDSELYRGLRLAQALDWQDRRHPELTSTEREFLNAGEVLAKAEEHSAVEQARHQRVVNRRLRALLTGVAILTLGALIATVVAVYQGKEATGQRNEAVALALAAASRGVADTNAALALALAAESSAATPTPLPQAFGALAQADLAFAQRTQPVREPLSDYTDAWSVVFSPDSKTLASAGHDAHGAEVHLWDVATGDELGQSMPGYGMAFSPEGDLLATLSADGVRLRNPTTGKAIGTPLIRPPGLTRTVRFNPQGHMLATAGSKGVQLWDSLTGRLIPDLFTGPRREIVAIAFSPDGEHLAAVDRRATLRLWSPRATAHAVLVIRERQRAGQSSVVPSISSMPGPPFNSDQNVAFIDNGSVMVSSGSGPAGGVRLWNPVTGDLEGTPLRGRPTGLVSAMAIDPRGDLIATSGGDFTVRLWSRTTGEPVDGPLRAQNTRDVAFSPNGDLLATASEDGTVRLWDPPNDDPLRAPLSHPGGGVGSLAFSSDGQFLASTESAGNSVALKLWNPDTGHPLSVPGLQVGRVSLIAFRPNTHEIATNDSQSDWVRFWDLDTGKSLKVAVRHPGGLFGLTFSAKGDVLATASADGLVRLWDPSTGNSVAKPIRADYIGPVETVAFSSDGRLLATGGAEGVVRLWDPATGHPVGHPILPDTGIITSVAFSPDGHRLATGGGNDTVRLWDVATGHPIDDPVRDHSASVTAVAFSPDGRLLVTGAADGTVWFWDPHDGDPIGGPFPAGEDSVAMTFRPRGGQLVTVSSSVQVWSLSFRAACEVAAKYVTRRQLRPFVASGWRRTCRYAN